MPPLKLSEYQFQAFQNFAEASAGVLDFLQKRVGFGLWMVTRTEGDDWIVLVTNNTASNVYQVKQGDVLHWCHSYCCQMVQGLGPYVAPRSQEIPVYANALINNQVPIAAYIGVPLTWADGRLFGTLCAIDPEPQPESILAELPVIQIQAQLLSTILTSELKAQACSRHLEQVRTESQLDKLTGVYNRRGWDRLVMVEEERCQRYGSPASIIILDLDNLKVINDQYGHVAGDRLLQKTAACLISAVRQNDVLARLGGDEFSVLAIEAGANVAQEIVDRIHKKLAETGIAASVGWAVREPHTGIPIAIEAADARMYEAKRQKHLTPPRLKRFSFLTPFSFKHHPH
ncbi:MAG TPA: sensor domain-containing diguanylate cyclase [Trichocoleus sp.]|jgi:diguanylate cyclase (GGDEF)-like protein